MCPLSRESRGSTDCKLDWREGRGGVHVTGAVEGRLVPGCFGSSLSCPLFSEAGLGAPVQPQGALEEVSQNVGGVGFWGAKLLWVTGALVPRGPGSGVGWSC